MSKYKYKITVTGETLEDFETNLIMVTEKLTKKTINNITTAPDKFAGGPVDVKSIPVDQLYNTFAAAENKPPIPTAPQTASSPIVTFENFIPDVDANNLPWDERIHAGTKTKTKKGIWKARKGVHDKTVTVVEAELRARVPQNIPSVPAAPAPQTFHAGDSFQPPAPLQPAAPTQANTFQNLMATISGLFANGGATPEYLKTLQDQIAKGFNKPIASITDLMNDQAMIDYAFVILKHDKKIA